MKFLRDRGATDHVTAVDHLHAQPGHRQIGRASEAVMPRPNDDDVGVCHGCFKKFPVIPGHRAAMNPNLEIPRCAIAHLRSGSSDHPGMTRLLLTLPEAFISAQGEVMILSPHPGLPAASPYAPLPLLPPAPAGSLCLMRFCSKTLPEPACFHLTSLHLTSLRLTRLLTRPSFPPAETGWF